MTDFAGQNWLITPAALAVGQNPPASIHDQQWLLILSGVVIEDFNGAQLHHTLEFTPDMAGAWGQGTSGPLAWAINRFNIPKPPNPVGEYTIGFELEEWAPFASVSSFFNQGQRANIGFAVDRWQPRPFGEGTDILSHQHLTRLFAGIHVDLAVRDSNTWIYRIGYHITLLGKIVFPKVGIVQ